MTETRLFQKSRVSISTNYLRDRYLCCPKRQDSSYNIFRKDKLTLVELDKFVRELDYY
jgi:hypothetical protein